MTVTHAKVSAIADVGPGTIIGPDEWNAAHSGFYGIGTFEKSLGGGVLLQDLATSRASASGWGTPTYGESAWVGGSGSVTAGVGLLNNALVKYVVTNYEPTIKFDFKLALGSSTDLKVVLRGVDLFGTLSGPYLDLFITAGGGLVPQIGTNLGGVGGTASVVLPLVLVTNTYHTVVFSHRGNAVFFKIWKTSDPEPFDWSLVADLDPLTDFTTSDKHARPIGTAVNIATTAGVDFSFVNLTLTDCRPAVSGTFDVTGLSGFTAGDDVCVFQVPGPYVNGGTLTDEAEMDSIRATGCAVDATTVRVYWESDQPVSGSYKFGYFSPVAVGVTHTFVSAIADDGTTKSGTSEWNAAHVGRPTFGTFEGELDGGVLLRDFDSRVSAAGWGQAMVGGAWVITGGGPTSVGAGVGVAKDFEAKQLLANVDSEFQTEFKADDVSGGGLVVLLRAFDKAGVTTGIGVLISFSLPATITCALQLSGTFGPVSALRFAFVANTYYTLQCVVVSSPMNADNIFGNDFAVLARVWPSGTVPPPDWDLITTGTTASLASVLGVTAAALNGGDRVSIQSAIGTNTFTFKNLSLTNPRPQSAGTFDVTGLSGLTAGKPVYVFQRVGPYSYAGSSTREDEAEMGIVSAVGYVVNATTIRVYWTSSSIMSGRVKFAYVVGG